MAGRSVKEISIGGRKVGGDAPCFIIAEISCNHLQRKEYALKLIEEAKRAGADAVKFQTYTPDTMTIKSDAEWFRIKGTIWEGRTLYDLYEEAYTPWDWFPELKAKAEREGLVFFSSPFDETAVDFLEKLGVPAYKIASFEINHIPLLKYVAARKKPVMISTGLADEAAIRLALDTIRGQGNDDILVMKCTSAYPAPPEEMNLRTIPDLEGRFGVVPGLSDHSLGITAPVAAVALGAKAIEKHFTLDRDMGGPDAEFSLEPKEFADMVKAVREAEQALGRATYDLGGKAASHRLFMRSIFAVKDIRPGEKLTRENIRVIRPGYGLHPRYYEGLLGKRAKTAIKAGTPMEEGMVT